MMEIIRMLMNFVIQRCRCCFESLHIYTNRRKLSFENLSKHHVWISRNVRVIQAIVVFHVINEITSQGFFHILGAYNLKHLKSLKKVSDILELVIFDAMDQ